MKPLTVERYVENRGILCPNCRATNFSCEISAFDASYTLYSRYCHQCGAEWDDCLELKGYINLYIPKQKEE